VTFIADKHYSYDVFRTGNMINEWLEDDMLPIGKNTFGDYIMLDIGSNNSGAIFFLYHDGEKEYKELAADFNLFTKICKSKRIGYIRTIEERKQRMIDNGLEDKITPNQ